jgi:hypothetical protein
VRLRGPAASVTLSSASNQEGAPDEPRLLQTEIETDQLLFTAVDDLGTIADDETPEVKPILLVIRTRISGALNIRMIRAWNLVSILTGARLVPPS